MVTSKYIYIIQKLYNKMVDETRALRARSELLPRGGVDPARAARASDPTKWQRTWRLKNSTTN